MIRGQYQCRVAPQIMVVATICAVALMLIALIMIFNIVTSRQFLYRLKRMNWHRHFPICTKIRYPSDKLHFYIKIGHVVMYLDTIRQEPYETLLLTHPVANQCSIKYTPWPTLQITWDRPLTYSINDSLHDHHLPTQLRLNPCYITALRTVMSTYARRYLLYKRSFDIQFHTLPWFTQHFNPYSPGEAPQHTGPSQA